MNETQQNTELIGFDDISDVKYIDEMNYLCAKVNVKFSFMGHDFNKEIETAVIKVRSNDKSKMLTGYSESHMVGDILKTIDLNLQIHEVKFITGNWEKWQEQSVRII